MTKCTPSYRLLAALLAWLIASTPAYSQTSRVIDSQKSSQPAGERSGGPGSEYRSSVVPGEILIPVNVIGGVAKAGVYHVPVKTEIVKVLALAGGPVANADLEHVTIQRRSGAKEEVVNAGLKDEGSPPRFPYVTLEADDVVYVPYKQPLISDESVKIVSFFSAIATMILAIVVFARTK